MAVVIAVIAGLVGLVGGVVHVTFFGASITQAFVTYFVASIGFSAAFGLVAWGASIVSLKSDRPRRTVDQHMEDWQDWHFEEEANAAARADSTAEDQSDQGRKSA